MQELVDGIHRFQQDVFGTHEQLFHDLVRGQKPLALFITCSDSRVDPSLLTQTAPGQLFVLRNAGNIVPPHGVAAGGEAATVEYAIGVLGVRDIIVCGHSHCGAMAGLLAPDTLKELPAVRSWLGNAESTRRIIAENYGHLMGDEARLKATIQENVLVQLEQLRTHPSVAAALGRHAVRLHGWVYKFETGQVFRFDPESGQFTAIDRELPEGMGLGRAAPSRGILREEEESAGP